jgi:hypothetical protein
MNVTPEIEVPIIPKATTYQGDLRLPTKNEALSAPRLVKKEIVIRVPKYKTTISNKIHGFIDILYFARIVKTFN